MLTRSQLEELRALPLWANLGVNTKILLRPDQIEFADYIGNKRQDTAEARRLRGNHGLVAGLERQRWLHILGARCEMAAWRYLGPMPWNCYVFDPSDLPDLSDWIEVKGVEHPNDTLIVPPKKNNVRPPLHWAYVLVNGCDHPLYEVVGWRWGHEFLDDAHVDQSIPRPTWRARPPYREPIELLEEVRLR